MLISIRGVRLNVVDSGGPGRPLVFLHGNGGEIGNWQPQLDALGGQFRTVGIDLRGFGRSDATLGEIEVADHADDVAGVLERLDLHDVVVVGLSLGGMVTLQLALDHPGRLAGVVVADSAAAFDEASRQALGGVADMALTMPLAAMAEAFAPALFAPATLAEPNPWIAMFTRQFGAADPWQHRLGTLAALRCNLMDRLGGMGLPTLVICGEHDQICPPALSEQIAAALPDAELRMVPDAAHVTNLEQPEAFTALVEQFVKRI